jgi:hypothetical protein
MIHIVKYFFSISFPQSIIVSCPFPSMMIYSNMPNTVIDLLTLRHAHWPLERASHKSSFVLECLQLLNINDQQYALSYITHLFVTQAPTCFGIHVSSSGSFSCPHELLESRNVYVVCHIL